MNTFREREARVAAARRERRRQKQSARCGRCSAAENTARRLQMLLEEERQLHRQLERSILLRAEGYRTQLDEALKKLSATRRDR